jgi:iron complex transport system permease protein
MAKRNPPLLTASGAKWALLAVLAPVTMLACLGMGRVDLGVGAVVKVLLSAAGWGANPDSFHYTVVFNARLPRSILAVLAGSGLSAAGSALQGCLRNPLVGPQTVGVLAGAGFGGSLMIFFTLHSFWVMAGAFGAGLSTTFFVVWLARKSGPSSVLMLVLSGIVVGTFFAALTTILQYLADPETQLPQLVFWLMGSFSAVTFSKVGWVVLPILAGMIVLFAFAFRLNVLSCGEEEAMALGVPVYRDRAIIIAAVTVICAAVVSVAGIIGWVGLVTPHIARMLFGPDHRRLLPASALIGAIFMVMIDTLCRSITAAELPVGAITAIVGGPVFISLLRRSHAKGWRVD